MARKLHSRDNFRVVIEPRSLTDFGAVITSRSAFYGTGADGQARWEREMRERCDDIAADVKRHADGVGSVFVESDANFVCGYCGDQWTERSPDYNGGCCAEDEAANPASADTHPKGGDAVEQAAPFMSGAVPEGETPR